MTKCSVVSVLKWNAGSSSEDASARAAASRIAAATAKRPIKKLIRRTRNPGNIPQEIEVGQRGHVHARQGALRDREIGLVPKADVRHVASHDPLHLPIQVEAAVLVRRDTCLVEQPVDRRIAVVPAVESGGWNLIRMK